MFRRFIKNKLKLKSSILTITTILLIATLISPQVLAITPVQLNTISKNINKKLIKSEVSADEIWFVKPVLKKMYIGDNMEINLIGNRTVILGAITLQAETEIQNGLISVRYNITDMENNSLGPDVVVTWSSEYPNYDYFYAKRHFPFSSKLPSKFKINAIAQFIGIPYASTTITVVKIF
jgi:hypothetical protein